MNLDFSTMFSTAPGLLDQGHAALGAVAIAFLLLYLTKKGKTETIEKQVEVEKPVEVIKEVEIIKEIEVIKEVEVIKEIEVAPKLKETTPEAALQLLSLLQQEARFIDFMSEDLSGFADAEIGAAARVIHEGGQKVLNEYFTLAPVRSEEEETQITLPEGFDAAQVRLTGNVVGKAPFTGTLVHKGWQVTDIKLPKMAQGHDPKIIAAAEVEL